MGEGKGEKWGGRLRFNVGLVIETRDRRLVGSWGQLVNPEMKEGGT